MVNSPELSLKVIVGVHLALSALGGMGALPVSYLYFNGFVAACGFWCLINQESVDAVGMLVVTNVCSVVLDIIFLSVSHHHGSVAIFAMIMAIINLVLKPFSGFVQYRLYQDRGGRYSDFGIPGMPNFGNNVVPRGYEDIDQSPSSGVGGVESAAPHHTIEKPLP